MTLTTTASDRISSHNVTVANAKLLGLCCLLIRYRPLKSHEKFTDGLLRFALFSDAWQTLREQHHLRDSRDAFIKAMFANERNVLYWVAAYRDGLKELQDLLGAHLATIARVHEKWLKDPATDVHPLLRSLVDSVQEVQQFSLMLSAEMYEMPHLSSHITEVLNTKGITPYIMYQHFSRLVEYVIVAATSWSHAIEDRSLRGNLQASCNSPSAARFASPDPLIFTDEFNQTAFDQWMVLQGQVRTGQVATQRLVNAQRRLKPALQLSMPQPTPALPAIPLSGQTSATPPTAAAKRRSLKAWIASKGGFAETHKHTLKNLCALYHYDESCPNGGAGAKCVGANGTKYQHFCTCGGRHPLTKCQKAVFGNDQPRRTPKYPPNRYGPRRGYDDRRRGYDDSRYDRDARDRYPRREYRYRDRRYRSRSRSRSRGRYRSRSDSRRRSRSRSSSPKSKKSKKSKKNAKK